VLLRDSQRSARRPRFVRMFAVALIALAAGFAVAAPTAPQAARAQDATHLSAVQSEYHILLASYWEPLDPADLLNAAWDGATAYLRSQGVTFSTARPQPAGDDEATAFAAFSTAWQALVAETSGKADPQLLAFAADEGMGNHLNDDHTGFISPQDYTQIQSDVGGAQSSSTGLGIIGGQRPPHLITEVAAGGPADKAGVRPGDSITAVNGKDVTKTSGADYLALLHGDAGTPITLTVQRPQVGAKTISVVIGSFSFPIFSSAVLPGNIGYMKLRGFPDPWAVLGDGLTFPQELDAALASFEQAGVKVWVLDLRDNPGGSVAANEALIGRFLADGRTAVATDARGNRSESLVDGHPFPQQEPLAVLINGGSYSSSEVTASTLHDYGRATLVGSNSGGALGTSEIFPLPDGAAVEVNVAPTVGGKDETPIDLVGVPVDVGASSATADTLAAGLQADPAVAAAVKAVQGQSVAPQPATDDGTLSREQLQTLLAPYQVAAADVPLAPEIPSIVQLGRYTINTDDEWVDFEAPAADALAARQLPKQRGWQGAVFQFFGAHPDSADIQTQIDLYATADGAAAALASNDVPDLVDAIEPPIQLGDGTVAYHGKWLAAGAYQLTWQHGRVLFSVALYTVPGEETFDPLVQLAQTIDALWQANPLP
jgi:C-terminal peptidase prc